MDEIILRDATCVHEGIGISTSRSSTSIAATMVGGSKASSGEHTKMLYYFLGSFAMTHDCSLRKWLFVNTNTLSPRISNFETHESMKPSQTVSHTVALHISYKFMLGGLSLLIPLAFSHASYHMFHIVSLCFQCVPCFSHISWRIRSWRITQDLAIPFDPLTRSTSLATARRARLAPWSHWNSETSWWGEMGNVIFYILYNVLSIKKWDMMVWN